MILKIMDLQTFTNFKLVASVINIFKTNETDLKETLAI